MVSALGGVTSDGGTIHPEEKVKVKVQHNDDGDVDTLISVLLILVYSFLRYYCISEADNVQSYLPLNVRYIPHNAAYLIVQTYF